MHCKKATTTDTYRPIRGPQYSSVCFPQNKYQKISQTLITVSRAVRFQGDNLSRFRLYLRLLPFITAIYATLPTLPSPGKTVYLLRPLLLFFFRWRTFKKIGFTTRLVCVKCVCVCLRSGYRPGSGRQWSGSLPARQPPEALLHQCHRRHQNRGAPGQRGARKNDG